MKRLTDGMKNEMHTINQRTESLYDQYMDNVLGDQYFYMLYRLNAQHGDELESYKVKLENFYSDTDVKEKFKHYQSFRIRTSWFTNTYMSISIFNRNPALGLRLKSQWVYLFS